MGLFFLVFGCAGKLAIDQTFAAQSEADAGGTVKIFVVFKGPVDQVASVTATVREYPDFSFAMNNTGEEGDEKAGDNIWTYTLNFPYETPANLYHFDISVTDQSGNEIITKGLEQQSTGRSGTIEITIK